MDLSTGEPGASARALTAGSPSGSAAPGRTQVPSTRSQGLLTAVKSVVRAPYTYTGTG